MATQKAQYKLTQTCLGNPLDLEVETEQFCVYCQSLIDPNFRDASSRKGWPSARTMRVQRVSSAWMTHAACGRQTLK